MPSKAEIKERIEKLYALANGGATEGEAKAAISMAEKLTAKYGIKNINKNRYGKAEPVGKSSSGNPKKSPPKSKTGKSNKNDDWKRDYYQKTIGYTTCIAAKDRETEKAVLLNIYLDTTAYPWWKGPYISVSVWMPKSCIKMNKENLWVVKEDLLMANLNKNVPWLKQHHPVFIGQEKVWFKIKSL